ncbi:hypothetical protein [Mycobacteroides abscessus]|uniref:hypothetical protein n=1 Tax=Mycobacteroides abscessus TaxID=36809 RepID=UPI000D85B0D4|nr:putative transposase [Mycobacteroides abscessus]
MSGKPGQAPHVLDQGIGHIYIRPAAPRLNGKVERSHRIDAEEFYRLLDGVVEGDTGLFNEKLKEWEDYYNSTDLTAASEAKPPTKDCYKRPKPNLSPPSQSHTYPTACLGLPPLLVELLEFGAAVRPQRSVNVVGSSPTGGPLYSVVDRVVNDRLGQHPCSSSPVLVTSAKHNVYGIG